MTSLDASLSFLAEHPGCYLFPVGAHKKPLFSGWQAASSNDPDQLRTWFEHYGGCNFALNCGKSGVAALDVDVKNGKQGPATLRALEQAHGALPPTYRYKTPSGGQMLLFGGAWANSVERKLGPGLDTRGQGGYALLPGSIIKGASYDIIHDGDFAPLPDWLGLMAGKPAERCLGGAQEPLCELDLPHNIDRAREYLETVAPAVEGDGGDAHTVQVAARLKDLGVSLDTAKVLMVEHFNPRCEPPWYDDELEKKVENAFRYCASRAPGQATAEAAFKPIGDGYDCSLASPARQAQERTSARPLPLRLDMANLRASRFINTVPAPIPYLFTNSLPLGELGFIAGPSGGSKSFWALQALVAAASGHKEALAGVLDLAVKPGKVFGLFCEDRTEILHQRLRDVLNVCTVKERYEASEERVVELEGIVGENLLIMSGVGHNLRLMEAPQGQLQASPFYDHLLEKLREVEDLRLVVLDCLSRLYGSNENDNTAATFFCELLERLAQETGATVLIVHHFGKPSSSTRKGLEAINERLLADKLRGASAFTAAARWQMNFTGIRPEEAKIIGVDPADARRYVAVAVPKLNNGEDGDLRFMKRGTGGALQPHRVLKRPVEGLEGLGDKILEEVARLEAAGTPMTARKFARVCAADWKSAMPKVTAKKLEDEIEGLQLAGKLKVIEHKIEGNGGVFKCLALSDLGQVL